MPILLLLILSSLSFANVHKVNITGLNFEYGEPLGQGTVQKVSIGFSLLPGPYPINITRTEDSFLLESEFVDVEWKNPWPFVYDFESVTATNTTANLGGKFHSLDSEYLRVRPKGRGDYKFQNIIAKCEGLGAGEFDVALMDDCRTKMDVTIKRVDVPADFILYRVFFGESPSSFVEDYPANDLKFSSKEGNFNLSFYMKYVFYAGLRAKGHFHYENNHDTIVIRVDQIKFGYLTVTKMLMDRLKEIIKSPHVKVEPPFIRIDFGKRNENK